jgi:hypothetical protein
VAREVFGSTGPSPRLDAILIWVPCSTWRRERLTCSMPFRESCSSPSQEPCPRRCRLFGRWPRQLDWPSVVEPSSLLGAGFSSVACRVRTTPRIFGRRYLDPIEPKRGSTWRETYSQTRSLTASRPHSRDVATSRRRSRPTSTFDGTLPRFW